MKFEESKKLQNRFLYNLKKLTDRGAVEWFRKDSDPELVFCLYEDDIFVFELHDGTEENLNPFDKTHGVTVKVRNHSLIWLEGLDDWELILSLVKHSKTDNQKLANAKQSVLKSLVCSMDASLEQQN